MTAEKPYSPETLAQRWGCSAEKVRLMCRDGEIASFRLGKLIRIPAAEVERYECQATTPSPSTEINGQSPSEKESAAFASRLVRQTVDSQNLAPVKFGQREQPRQANG